jgi:hypothetical protein
LTTKRVVVAAAIACLAASAAAQDKTRLTFTIPASLTKYTAQHTLPVGDAPGHEVRIFAITRTLGADAPSIGGVKVKDIASTGYSDYTDLNGPGTSYQVITLVNGDKIFARANIVSHNLAWTDASKKGAENRVAGPITGGTGKFVGIRGTMRNASQFDPRSGSNDSRFDLEYWIQAQH